MSLTKFDGTFMLAKILKNILSLHLIIWQKAKGERQKVSRILNSWRSSRRVRDWSGILLKRSGKRYSGKPDGVAGTPKKYRMSND